MGELGSVSPAAVVLAAILVLALWRGSYEPEPGSSGVIGENSPAPLPPTRMRARSMNAASVPTEEDDSFAFRSPCMKAFRRLVPAPPPPPQLPATLAMVSAFDGKAMPAESVLQFLRSCIHSEYLQQKASGELELRALKLW